MKILSPCISICKSDPKTGFCYGCARTDQEKKIWKNLETTNDWKNKNLKVLTLRMSETQLKTFNQSYDEKIKFGKLVYSKNLEKKPKS
jgi:Predicted Fe-S protein